MNIKRKIKILNKKIFSYYNNNCKYINLYNKLIEKDDDLKEKYTKKILHLNSLVYVVVTRKLYHI